MARDAVKHYSVYTGLYDLNLHSRSQECEKAKYSAVDTSQSFQSILTELCKLLRLVGLINLTLILSCVISIQGRETYSYDFIEKGK